jgi:hypothetical protein
MTFTRNRLGLTHQHSNSPKPRASITHNKAFKPALRLSLRKPEECQWRAHPWDLRVVHKTRHISPVERGRSVRSSLGLGRSWKREVRSGKIFNRPFSTPTRNNYLLLFLQRWFPRPTVCSKCDLQPSSSALFTGSRSCRQFDASAE